MLSNIRVSTLLAGLARGNVSARIQRMRIYKWALLHIENEL